ncbi:MAG TPA: hypothetical protein VNV86_05290 [Candidatus Acidoferrum sp.]|nr:hypothetical protein [Candidatus Acidoferrum sp.]
MKYQIGPLPGKIGLSVIPPVRIVYRYDPHSPSSPWQTSSRIGNAGETARRNRLRHHRESTVCRAGGAGIQPAWTSTTGCWDAFVE